MLKNDRSGLDYMQLVRRDRRRTAGGGVIVRLALLADVSTQHLVPVLRALFAENGIDAVIHEAGYDTIELEALDPSSELFRFDPGFVVILQSMQKLREAYYGHRGERESFASARAARAEEVWKAIRAKSAAQIVQCNYVLPYERPFGNYGNKVDDTFCGEVRELNREIATRAREHPGVFVSDLDFLSSWLGRRSFLDEKLWALSKSLCALELLPEVAQSIVDIVLAATGRAVKCVVLDLDNTLWGGVVGEDGLEGIGLGDLDDGGAFRFLQQFMLTLSRRGIVLAVCSKNDEALARRVFREHPAMVLREEDITVFVANWNDKATNIRRIREQLNIGFDSMVFLDDNPFERNLVRQMLPEVIVPELPEDPVLYVRAIAELNLFEAASHSALDGQRAALYRDQGLRDEERARFQGIEEYLESLGTEARCARFEPRDLPRIAQLIQRSNQFNLTTKRYGEAECAAMMRDETGFHPFSVTLRDRFGDFGLISVVVLRKAPPALEIDSFLMSCRVLQRGVEQHAMNTVFEIARREGFERVTGRYVPTAKNAMVRDFFTRFGFECVASGDDGSTEWSLAVGDYVPARVFVRERSEASSGEGERRSDD